MVEFWRRSSGKWGFKLQKPTVDVRGTQREQWDGRWERRVGAMTHLDVNEQVIQICVFPRQF